MLSWNEEMNKMLIAFDRQAKCSLASIKMALKRDGLSLNSDFKQYFLRISNERIKNTYDEFEISSMFEDQINVGAYGYTSIIDTFSMMNSFRTENHDNGFRTQMDDPVEIIESSDEEDQPGYRIKMETPFGTLYNSHGETFQLNDLFKNDDDVSYAHELSNTNLIGIDFQDVSKSYGHDSSKKKAASTVKVDDNIPLIAVNDRKMGSKNKRISTVTSSKRSKLVGVAHLNRSELGLISQSIRNKKSISSNQMEMKKRLKCRLCEYSSNLMWNINRHMRTHTGDRPYQCDICRKEFTTMQNMKKHKVTHTEQIPFHCRGCFTGFSQKCDQAAHEKVCKMRRYECHICKKSVTSHKNRLKEHMRTHNGEKPFRCEICMMRFTQKNHVKTHLDTIHTRITA